MFKRTIFSKLLAHLVKQEFTIVTGARQIGKSTLLKQLYQQCLTDDKVAYFLNLDRREILDALNENPENIFRYCPTIAEDRIYIFIDEIQYLDQPTAFLKFLYDEYVTKIKIIATGSSAFYIDQKFNDSLVGRKKIFQLNTLSFEEYLIFQQKNELLDELKKLKRKNIKQSIHEVNLWNEMLEYTTFGGYPAVVLETDKQLKIEKLLDIRDSFVKRDILESGVLNETKFYHLFRLLAEQAGNLMNTNELANKLKLSNAQVENYIYVLQKCFHISVVRPYYNNLRKELIKMPKVYINDLGLRNALLNYFEPLHQRGVDKGKHFENICFRIMKEQYTSDQIKFWRTADGNEVDFIIEKNFKTTMAIEIKFDASEVKISKYNKFMQAYPNIDLSFWWWNKPEVLTWEG